MLLVDFNQVVISSVFANLGNHTNAPIEIDMLRHMILNNLRSYKQKFGEQYGKIVIAADGRRSWRKDVFPYYKGTRQKQRQSSEIDWVALFNMLSTIRDELKDVFPYEVVHVEAAEADDIIATLVEDHGNTSEKILILSDDKDHIQLQKYLNVKQYAPIKKKWLSSNDPEMFLREHILTGDRVDAIPNFLSKDDVFLVPGARQKKLMSKKLDEWKQYKDPAEFCDEEMLRGYRRNEQLISYDKIPADLKDQIREAYKAQHGKDRSKLFNYFIQHQLKHLMSDVGSF